MPPPADNISDEACFFVEAHPSDLALIEDHLRPWVAAAVTSSEQHKQALSFNKNHQPPSSFVHVADLYSASPAELARKFAPTVSRDGGRVWYFLTRLRRKSAQGRGKRFARTVDMGGGWWHGEAKEKPIVDVIKGGQEVGRRQLFSFMREDCNGARVRTGWIMTELRLLDSGGGYGHWEEEDLVLCRVYRSPRHPGGDTKLAVEKKADSNESSAISTNDSGDQVAWVPSCDGNTNGETVDTVLMLSSRYNKNVADGDRSLETYTAAPSLKRATTDGDRMPCKRKAMEDDDNDDNLAMPRRRTADGSSDSGATGPCCPQCGFRNSPTFYKFL